MDCNEFRNIVADLFDKDVDTQIKAECEKHISQCAECKAYYVDLLSKAELLRPKHSPVVRNEKSEKRASANLLYKIAASFIGIIMLSGIALAAYHTISPKQDDVALTDSIYNVVPVNASFPGGDAKCFDFLSKHIRYPRPCHFFGIQGRVIVKFVIEKDGSITNIKKIPRGNGIKLTKKQVDDYNTAYPDNQENLQVGQNIGDLLYVESERVLKEMPKWNPAKNKDGKIVRSNFTLPIIFKLK